MVKEKSVQKFAEKYKLYLFQNKITYRQIGDAIDVCANTVGNWLRGDKYTKVNKQKLIDGLKIVKNGQNIPF